MYLNCKYKLFFNNFYIFEENSQIFFIAGKDCKFYTYIPIPYACNNKRYGTQQVHKPIWLHDK